MNPVAFEVFGLEVKWYAILISLGMISGIALAMYRSRSYNIDSDSIIDIALFALPAAIIGARIYYVAFEWERYSGDIVAMINIRQGGLAIHGGLIAGVLVGVLVCRHKKLNPLKLMDLLAPSIILGQAIGRWGNFMNNEAHGGPTDLPWAIEVDGEMVHPTFLYESIWNFMVMFFLIVYDKKFKKFEGEVFLMYGILYSVGRFFIEGMRTDSLYLGPLRIAQVVSLVTIALFGAIILYSRRKARRA